MAERAILGDVIACDLRRPVPCTVRVMLATAAAVAYANDLLVDPSRGWKLAECPCFPGTCRGGEVIGGRLANGLRCRSAGGAAPAPQFSPQRATDGAPAAVGDDVAANGQAVSGAAADHAGVAVEARVDAGEDSVGGGHVGAPKVTGTRTLVQAARDTGTGVGQ